MEIASSNFPQQGQVDWVALSSSSLTFTRDLLARLAKANIDANTVATGRVLFSAFSVGPRVQNEMLETLKTLKSFQSYGNLIWLGFGVKSLVRDLADSEPGLACIALCSCLSMSYGSFFAGEVLRDFTKHRGAPAEFIPSIHQWSTLVDLCAGSMARSKFPFLLEGLIRLAFPGTDPSIPKPTSSEALSKALNIVADISNRKLVRATFVGSLDCLWLAALSEWLLSLRVEIISAEGTLIYMSSTANSENSQVVIILDPTDGPKAGPLIARKWHIIPTGSKLWMPPKPGTPTFSGTHSKWTTILRDTFGSSFSKLIDESTMDQFGYALIVSSCNDRDHDPGFALHKILRLDTKWSVNPRHPQWSTLCEFVSSRLPELTAIMDRCNSNPIDGDRDPPTYLFRRICPCESSGRDGSAWMVKEFCLSGVVETIAFFLRILALLEVETSLLPYPAGLRLVYQRHRTKVMGIRSLPGETDILPIALEIFTGKTQVSGKNELRDLSAICNDGICAFYRVLEDLDLSPEQAFKVRLVQGHIEFEGSARTSVGIVELEQEPEVSSDAKVLELGPHVSYSLIVEETPHPKVINAAYRILSSSQPGESLVNIVAIVRTIISHCKGAFGCREGCSHAHTSAGTPKADISPPIQEDSTNSSTKAMSLNLGWSIIWRPQSFKPDRKKMVTVIQASFPRMYLEFYRSQQLRQHSPSGFVRLASIGGTADPHLCPPCLVDRCYGADGLTHASKKDTVEITLCTPSQSNKWKFQRARNPQFEFIPLLEGYEPELDNQTPDPQSPYFFETNFIGPG
ncbi:hypothetical protein FQN51_000891 [Onygenales sp. PD_10]|nr:hypothetical protein FQN51_000891 [Onygenales sp. PD_10]